MGDLSRRLGRSLGINLLPVNRKVCSFNCVYCQYGEGKVDDSERTSMTSFSKQGFGCCQTRYENRTIEFLTFSGNGDPTLHRILSRLFRGSIFAQRITSGDQT